LFNGRAVSNCRKDGTTITQKNKENKNPAVRHPPDNSAVSGSRQVILLPTQTNGQFEQPVNASGC
jgi:hypothetical protein